MDLLAELRAKLGAISGYEGAEGVAAAVRHIVVAERYLTRGRDERDDDAFNDVIYRTNQAFEGMLKEALRVLVGAVAKNLTPSQIEQKLLEAKVLSSRVNVAVTRYRQEWRNPSTHDHTLLFTEQDALLAIVSVSAFAAVLLDQMLEVLSFRKRKAAVEQQQSEVAAQLSGYGNLTFDQQVVALLQAFAGSIQADNVPQERSEAELLGELGGFLAAADPNLRITLGGRVGDRDVDVLLEKNGSQTAVDLKRGVSWQFYRAAANQFATTLAGAGLQLGYVFIPPRNGADLMVVRHVRSLRHGAIVYVVAPKADDEA